MQSKHAELTNLCRQQQKQIEIWESYLLNTPKELKKALENALGVAGEKWEVFKQQGEVEKFDYVQVARGNDDRTTIQQSPDRTWIDENDGMLGFCLIITFICNSQKVHRRVFVKAKIEEEVAKYAPWMRTPDKTLEVSDWYSSADEFAAVIIKELERLLSINPMEAPVKPRKIGFIIEA